MFRHQGIQKETEKAWLVLIEGQKLWLPKSKCSIEGSEVSIPKWLAKQKGLKGLSEVETELAHLFIDGNEAEAQLAREEVFTGEISEVLKAVKKASELTGLSQEEILFQVARAA
jgi:hypothetical protein